ncbi:phage tail-collar fiber domain-containing protein [Shewanella halifaxensis]|uniref:phage tail-collar fiber domain-containing protein n=1 Tax=Shewanella halifaxensis TaxID=271098 RepID=UPI000D59556C|nr:phage tail protein [Shewanella halifaxensis]
MARLTTIGQSLISTAVGSGPKLDITKFVFANIPDLDHTSPEPADESMPAPEHIVFERAPTKAGIIDENRVTYSQMMLTDIGDFSFNWIGLVQGSDLVIFAYVPLTQKVKTEGSKAGNTLTRNLVIEHLGIANATPVVVSAESWMYDYSAELDALTLRITSIENELPNYAVKNLVYTKAESDARFQPKGSYAAVNHNHDMSYAAKIHNHSATNITSGTLNKDRLPDATTGAKGAVKLNSSTTSASTTEAATPRAVKSVNDSVNNAMPYNRRNPGTVTSAAWKKYQSILYDNGGSYTFTIDPSVLSDNDIVEVEKANSNGQINVRNNRGQILLPNGPSDNQHYIPGGKCGLFRFKVINRTTVQFVGGF